MVARRRLFHARGAHHEPSFGDAGPSDSPPGGNEMYLGCFLRDRFTNLTRLQPQPTEDELLVQSYREARGFERKLRIIRHNPAMFRRYQEYAVRSRHFSPTGLCHVLLDFMSECMKIPEILDDIRKEGGHSRYPALIVANLDEYDTETITFDNPDAEDADADSRTPFAIPENGPLIPSEGSLVNISPFSTTSSPSSRSISSEPDPKSTADRQKMFKNYDSDDQNARAELSVPSLAGTDTLSDDSSTDSGGVLPGKLVGLLPKIAPLGAHSRPLVR